MVAKSVIVGLLGGIASGKSTVADRLVRRGAFRIDADRLAHAVLRSEELAPLIREVFGDGVMDDEGRPDRRRIGEIVFAEPSKLRALERLIHPRVRERIETALGVARNVPAVVVDAPLLLEGGLAEIVDVLVFVVASMPARIDRTRTQRGWDPDELPKREARQVGLPEKKSRARLTIRNDGSLEDLDRRVDELWRAILSEGLPSPDETQQGDMQDGFRCRE